MQQDIAFSGRLGLLKPHIEKTNKKKIGFSSLRELVDTTGFSENFRTVTTQAEKHSPGD
jgi:hypothetical protein